MSDIKKMVSEKIGQVKASTPTISYSKERDAEAENMTKARKILTFAEPILREFAQQIGKKVKRVSNKDGYGWPDCIARYEIYTPNFLGFPKKDSHSLEVTIGKKGGRYGRGEHSGYSVGSPLGLGVIWYGGDVSIDQINEEWFVSMLAKAYERMRGTPSYYDW